jgi:hypothetical protein
MVLDVRCFQVTPESGEVQMSPLVLSIAASLLPSALEKMPLHPKPFDVRCFQVTPESGEVQMSPPTFPTAASLVPSALEAMEEYHWIDVDVRSVQANAPVALTIPIGDKISPSLISATVVEPMYFSVPPVLFAVASKRRLSRLLILIVPPQHCVPSFARVP